MKMDWSSFTNRISELETKRKPSANRRAVFEVIRNSKLRPNPDYEASLYLGPLIDPQGRPLCLEYTNDRPNLWFHESHVPALREAGLDPSRKPPSGSDSEGRHSGLKSKGFQNIDAWKLGDLNPDMARVALSALSFAGDLQLNPIAITRWIDRLHHFFPNLDRFDRPDQSFDDAERNYKLATINKLRPALEKASDDGSITQAVFAAATNSNNLLDWRTTEPLAAKSNADHGLLDPALALLVRASLGSPERHADALDAFAHVWIKAVPNGTEDAARQIGEFVFFHLWPDNAVYIRHTVRQDLWREAMGDPFPQHATLAETYIDEMRFMNLVRQAFDERGLAPRDMIDIQSALWVVHNYTMEGTEMSQVLDRAQIESAMDAYDSYRMNRAHSEVFSAFGEPRDYWVRSSRERENRIYPTKPLIGFILSRTELNGGWGQKADAAARLHNAGFIIVDQKNQPIERPERYEHLIEGADRIRLCALNYFIEPAREKVAREVLIRAGDLATALGLKDAFPNICQALGGEKLQKLAQVPPPKTTEPNPSSSTVFTYTLVSQPEVGAVTDINNATSPKAVNLILYGPPGTGKTYATTWEAVRLCLGDENASVLAKDRDALMTEYRSLVNDGRIEFVTFHQSMSYEEFVEGLRPSTGDDDLEVSGDTESGTGFRLQCHEGIFKRISERARLDKGNYSGSQHLNRSARVFKVALGRRHDEDDRIRLGLDNDLIHLGWGEDIDWSDKRFDEFDEILSEWRSRKNPDASGHDGNIVCTYSFRADMQKDDYVVVSDGRDRIQAFGIVASEYYYDSDATYHPHRRKMKWLWSNKDGTERSRFYPNGFRRHSVYKLNQSLVDWDALEEIAFGEGAPFSNENSRNYVLVIDEINRANISKVFGELITLLEQDKRLGAQNEIRVQLPYSKKRFGVAPNLHIVGTMNTADRSIALLDTALRRRFTFQELMPDPTVLSDDVGGINLRNLLSTINERIEYLFDREHQIGHAYFTGCRSREDVEDVMRHKVIPLLAEYFYEDWAKVAAVLGDGPGMAKKHFLEFASLQPPKGMPEDDDNGEKLRWSVKADFDFSEFEA